MLRDIILWITTRLRPGSAQQIQQQLAQALNQGTNPTQGTQNINVLTRAMGGLTNAIRQAGTLFLTYFGGRAIVRFLEESIMMFARFDQKMQQSIAYFGNVDKAMKEKLGDRARELAKEVNMSAEQLAEVYLFLAQAGLTAAQAFEAIPVVALFAKAGMMDAAKAAELLAQTTSALGYRSEDPIKNLAGLARISDVVAMAAAKSQASIEEFAVSLSNKAGNSLRLFNKDVEEGVAALAVMANQGVKGAVAGERLDMFLRQATQAAIKNKEAFKQYGIQIFDTSGNVRNLADISDDLTRALGHLSDEQQTIALQQLGFQVRSVFAVKAFIGQAEAMHEYEQALRSASGYSKKVAEEMMLTPIEQWGLFKKRMTDARMELGEAFIPALVKLGDQLGDPDNPESVVGRLKAFAQYLKENPEIITAAGNVINWLVTKPITAFLTALDMVADLIVFTVSGSLFILAEAFNLVAFTAAFAVKAVGAFIKGITFGAVDIVDDFGNKLFEVQKKINDFANSQGWKALQAGKHFIIDLTSEDEDKPKPKKKRIIDNTIPGFSGRDGPKHGSGTIPGLTDPETAEKIEKLNKRLAEMLAQHTASSVDDQLIKLRELEKGFKEIYGDKLPFEVRESLKKIKSAIGAEDAVKALKQQFQDLFKEADMDELDVEKLGAFINQIKDLRDETDKNSDAWKALNDLLNEALQLMGKFDEEEEKKKKKKEDEALKAYEKRMAKIRRIGEHVADALADAFGMFYDVLTEGSERGIDAFEALGRGILSAMTGGLAEFAMLKARKNFILAAESVAQGFKALGDPITAPLAGASFTAAAKFAAVGAMWAALGGTAGAAASGLVSHAHGMNRLDNDREPGSGRVDDSRRQGPIIHIHVDGVDPKNPRHQKLLGDTIEEWAERTGGTIIMD